MKGIRKVRKARWVYQCAVCDTGDSLPFPDLFRALEVKQGHEKSLRHATTIITEAFKPVVTAYAEMSRAIVDAMEPIIALSAPPPNVPHDPTLLKDRRKWGGR